MKSQSLKQAYKTVILGCSSMKMSIPLEWEVKSIESCCEILDNLRKPLNESDRSKIKGDIPYYGANGVLDYINDYIFNERLILVAEDGGYFDEYRIRPIAYRIDGRAWVNNHAHVLRTKPGVDSDWVFYNLAHRNLIPLVNGSTRSKLNGSELRIIKLPMPPLQEQQKIASVLSKVDALIQKTDEIIEQMQRLKKGLMQKLLMKGVGHNKFKNARLFPIFSDTNIPDTWQVNPLEEVASLTMGQSPDGMTYNSLGVGMPLLNGPTEFGITYPTPIQFTNAPTRVCDNGDILLCVRGSTTGRMNLADRQYCIGRRSSCDKRKERKINHHVALQLSTSYSTTDLRCCVRRRFNFSEYQW